MSWFTMYYTTLGHEQDNPDAPLYLHISTTGEGAYFDPERLKNITTIISRFPKRGHNTTERIFGVARYNASQGDQETMLVFGWGDESSTHGGMWNSFFKISLKEALLLELSVLREKVIQASVRQSYPHWGAIGTD